MGEETVYCHTCGIRISSADFKKRRAIKLLARSYCQKCATKDVIEEAGKAEMQTTHDPPRPTTRNERKRRKESTGREVLGQRRRPRLRHILGVSIGVILVILVIVLLFMGSE